MLGAGMYIRGESVVKKKKRKEDGREGTTLTSTLALAITWKQRK